MNNDSNIEQDALDYFGKAVVRFFRDEPMELHDSYVKSYTGQNKTEILRNILGSNMSEDLKKGQLEGAKFFNSLSEEQLLFLNKYMLKFADHIAFIVMRALDEKTSDANDRLQVNVDGISATDLPMIGNGNLSGEYLDWCERFSENEEFSFK